MINEDLILMFTIRGFLLANKEENLAESLKLFINRHPEIFENKPEVIITGPEEAIAEPDIAKLAETEEVKFRKNFKTVEVITADDVVSIKKKRFLHRNTPIIQKFNGLIVKTWKSQNEVCKKLGYASTNISKAANHGGKAYGFTWEWKK